MNKKVDKIEVEQNVLLEIVYLRLNFALSCSYMQGFKCLTL